MVVWLLFVWLAHVLCTRVSSIQTLAYNRILLVHTRFLSQKGHSRKESRIAQRVTLYALYSNSRTQVGGQILKFKK